MPCYSPLEAWQREDGKIVFVERGPITRSLSLPCGQCIGCRLERSRSWAVRCMHESQMHEFSSFVTLTYSSLSTQNQSLCYPDFQSFMRRLRKRVGKVRFYMCGEYGELNSRPHFHACLFGVHFEDRVLLRSLPSGSKIYRSALLEELWPHGYSSVGDVTFESAAYVARYVCKKVTGDLADSHYLRVDGVTGEVTNLVPEFCHMSLKPGIGATWFAKFGAEVFPVDRCISRGQEVRPPKFYYATLLKSCDPFMFDEVSYDRFRKSVQCVEDSTPARLAVRETVTRARLSFKKRALEY